MEHELKGTLLDEQADISLRELCVACRISADRVHLLVEEGVIEPFGEAPAVWRFQRISISRVRKLQRLEQDLGLNLAGAALALDLVEEIAQLKKRLNRLEDH